jgi:hypothetical protein
MPMGLLEHMAAFFAGDEMRKVPQCPKDYRLWQQTMYTQFGQKWAKLHHGPMWASAAGNRKLNTMEAKVNIPALSESTIRRDITRSDVTTTTEIQAAVLDEASRTHPSAWWWVKADGCDLVEGLGESINLDWCGDVDMNDGELQAMYKIYRERLDFISVLGMNDRRDTTVVVQDLDVCLKGIKEDMSFVGKGVFDEFQCVCVPECFSVCVSVRLPVC